MKHNFPELNIVCNKKVTIQELKELLHLAVDANLPLGYIYINDIKVYPYIAWSDNLCQSKNIEDFDLIVSFEEFKAFIQGKGKYKEPFKEVLELNKEYKAEITKQQVNVGCQTFSHEIIKKLYESSQKALKS